uniref:N-acyl-aliphatic-L-amino acid amidohydrolase n=1 Tax=Sinocyclocheilus grahami TaxID=75366 RepID=A0A672KXG9_SINGR
KSFKFYVCIFSPEIRCFYVIVKNKMYHPYLKPMAGCINCLDCCYNKSASVNHSLSDAAVRFLERIAEELALPMKKVEVCPGRVVAIITWVGSRPELKSVVLNSHTDVVPVYEEHWKHDPFAAVKDEHGNIYGRGSQDMKCVTIQYIEAIRRLKAAGKRFSRTIHLTFVPDEEVGGHKGMETFVKHPEFQKLNIGFALDEGKQTGRFTASYKLLPGVQRERETPVSFILNLCSEHLVKGDLLNVKLHLCVISRLNTNECFTLGDVTTVNMTMVKGGVAYNVIPAEMDVSFDLRIPPTVNLQEFEEKIKAWCKEAGEDVTYDFAQKHMDQNFTSTEESDPWWHAFSSTCKAMNVTLQKEIFPAATDSRFIREEGLPAIGFSPMNLTPILLHDHNEYLNEQVFLRGIQVYERLVPALASVPPLSGEE